MCSFPCPSDMKLDDQEATKVYLLCSTPLFSALICSFLLYPSLLYSTLLYFCSFRATLLHSALSCSFLLYSTLPCSFLLFSAVVCSSVFSSLLHSALLKSPKHDFSPKLPLLTLHMFDFNSFPSWFCRLHFFPGVMKRTIPFYTGRNACTDNPCWVCRVATGPGLISTLAAYLHSRIIFSSCLVLACRPSIRHGLENEFKVNIEPNHTTLAGAMSSSKSTNSIFYCQNHLHNDSVLPKKGNFSWNPGTCLAPLPWRWIPSSSLFLSLIVVNVSVSQALEIWSFQAMITSMICEWRLLWECWARVSECATRETPVTLGLREKKPSLRMSNDV